MPQGSTVQRLLVTTASCAWAVNETGSRVLAAGAVERLYDVAFAPEVADAYTAAWVLRAGLADSATAEALRTIVKDAVSIGGDGLARVTLPAGVVGPDGRPPQEAEVLALAALALEGDERPALLAALMSAWAPGRGFGGPAASVAALDALKLSSLGTKPESMAVVLKIDGVEVTRHTLRADEQTTPRLGVGAACGLNDELFDRGVRRGETYGEATGAGLRGHRRHTLDDGAAGAYGDLPRAARREPEALDGEQARSGAQDRRRRGHPTHAPRRGRR